MQKIPGAIPQLTMSPRLNTLKAHILPHQTKAWDVGFVVVAASPALEPQVPLLLWQLTTTGFWVEDAIDGPAGRQD
jgi:hypothetical protein